MEVWIGLSYLCTIKQGNHTQKFNTMTHSAAANALNTFEPSEKIRQVTFHNLNKGDFFTFEPNPFNPMVKISANQAMNKKSEIVVFEPKSRSVVYKFN